MTTDEIKTDVANHMLALPPAEFEAWLQGKCPADQPETDYGRCLSAYLAGMIDTVWAMRNAGGRAAV